MSFDTLAPHYCAMEALFAGRLMQQCRTAFLDEAAPCRRALLLGEGPGRFLAELLRTHSGIEVTCVERSPRMIEQAAQLVRRRGLDDARVTFEPCDALVWSPPRGVHDLVVTNFFLDCFRSDQVGSLVAKVAASATDNARWLVSDFRVPVRGWPRWRARLIVSLLYGFFRLTTNLSASRLAPPDGFLRAAGFRLARRRLASFGLVHSDVWLRGKP